PGGRFARAGAAAPFDLLRSMRRLFAQAEKKGDLDGCAKLARVINNLAAAPASVREQIVEEFDWYTEAELGELRAMSARSREMRAAAQARMAAGEPRLRDESGNWPERAHA